MTLNQTSTIPPSDPKVFVKFRPDTPEQERTDAIINQYNGTLIRWLPQIDTAIVRVTAATAQSILQLAPTTRSAAPADGSDGGQGESAQAEEAVGAFSQILRFFMQLFGILTEGAEQPAQRMSAQAPTVPSVLRVEADGEVHACEDDTLEPPPPSTAIPLFEVNDPEISTAYGLGVIRAQQAWNTATGSECTVAVIDTGIDATHAEFAGRIVEGFNYVSDNDDTLDDNGHGTHVAGIIGAAFNNAFGAAGASPECTLLPVKVLDNNNLGSWSDVVSGILYAVDAGADVINLSLGASSTPPDTVRDAIEVAVASTVVVAAAGNAATSLPFYPAAYDGVVAVAGINQSGLRWTPSNYGDWVDIAAPAENIYATASGGAFEMRSGTSMATGFVSGTAALIHQTGITNQAAIAQKLTSSAREVTGGDSTNRQLGAGVVDALFAVDGGTKIFLPFVS